MDRLICLKEKIFETSNEDCFIEREQFFKSVLNRDTAEKNYYANLFSDLLSYVSVPVSEEDIFVGRVVEGRLDIKAPSRILSSVGHLTPDYNELLTHGYEGVLEKIKKNAAIIGSEQSKNFADNSEIVIKAIQSFALRYAEAAKTAGNNKAYEALKVVPFKPAYDLYSALQGIWLVHMIASCYIGERDYAFGYMDEYLYPFYLKEKERGVTDDEIRYMLSGFMIKANEICGRGTHNYNPKPVLCQASKQYLMLGGASPNRLTELFLEAACQNCMAQPEITVAMSKDAPDKFKNAVADALSVLTDKLQVYNYDLLRSFLTKKGLPEDITKRPSFSACCTFDLSYHSIRDEFYVPTVKLFCDTLFENEFNSIEELKKKYAEKITAEVNDYIQLSRRGVWGSNNFEKSFLLDSLLNPDSVERCAYPQEGIKYKVKNVFLPGIATLGDSLYALDELVFSKKEISYSEFINALKNDFDGYEELRIKALSLPKFGNDFDTDKFTAEMGKLLIAAVNSAEQRSDEILIPAFYSLERENSCSKDIPATPDGRKAGTPFSENQSPTYGADKKGITALLNSLSKLPFADTAAGGLNLTFSSAVKGEILSALIKTYFENGGIHIGITVLDKEVLRDAMKNPDKYKALTVRLYGFSEYFVSLPEWQQIAVLNRTEY